jgi:hypothetical protein
VRFLPILIVTAMTAGLCASSAAADSIVYAKKGDLYLTSPDGSKGYRLTTGGGYSSPSQADNGIIGALRYGKLVRLDRRWDDYENDIRWIDTGSYGTWTWADHFTSRHGPRLHEQRRAVVVRPAGPAGRVGRGRLPLVLGPGFEP